MFKQINLKIRSQEMAEQWWRVKIQQKLLKVKIKIQNKNGKKSYIRVIPYVYSHESSFRTYQWRP